MRRLVHVVVIVLALGVLHAQAPAPAPAQPTFRSGTTLVEVSGFTFMAIFIARLGTEAVAGHQIAVNLGVLLFMVPMSLSNAAGTLVAQRIGARDTADA